jgi:aspartyl-tRNA(Asn)/glutamyl-tRNA(Gln) amidotransferase subunit A
MSPDIWRLSIAELSRLIRDRKLSPVEVTKTYLARIAALDGQVNAFITVTDELALRDAQACEREIMAGRYRGVMHGIPFGVKDVINTAGIRTTAHSRIYIDNVPRKDAAAVINMREAGAVMLGKLATHEFAFGGCFDLPWPPARNPWNVEFFTGGSSSGSAAAVAAGFVPAAISTDTGGSIRTPSSLNGVVGLKPTYDLISRDGVIPNSVSFDHVGPMTWTVDDCRIVLAALAGEGAPANLGTLPTGGDLKGIRIGVVRHFWEEDLPANDTVRQAMESALEVFRKLGAQVETLRLRPAQDYYDVKMVIAETELFSTHQKDLVRRPHDFGPEFITRSIPACLFHSVDFIQAQRQRRRLIAEAAPIFDKYDVIVTASPGPAPRLDSFRVGGKEGLAPGVIGAGIDFWRRPSMTTPFSVLGIPALALCTGFDSRGMPLSMQIAGGWYDESTIFRVAGAYEAATTWRARRPELQPDRPPLSVPPAAPHGELPVPDEATRRIVELAAGHAGLKLTERQFAELCMAAPLALKMAQRIPRDFDRSEAPADELDLARLIDLAH